MKSIRYMLQAAADLQKHHAVAARILKKIAAYAETGAGDVIELTGRTGKRLRVGDFRVIFEDSDTKILVTKIGPRKNVYD